MAPLLSRRALLAGLVAACLLGGVAAPALADTTRTPSASPLAVAPSSLSSLAGLAPQVSVAADVAATTAPAALSGILVDSQTGAVLWSHAPDRAVAPASTLKVLTAAAALEAMGPDAVLSTRVVRGGGTVWLIGGGDPLLTWTQVKAMAATTATTLRASHIRSVRLVTDNCLFRAAPRPTGWPASYIPGEVAVPSALRMRGDRTSYATLHARSAFAATLTKAGVKVTSTGNACAPVAVKRSTTLAVAGHPLREVLAAMLLPSDNTIAEALGHLVAARTHRPATYAGAAAAERALLARHGVSLTGLRIYDSSGLSRSTRITPRALAAVLLASQRSTGRLHALVGGGLLPVAGETGTLSNRFTGTSACARGLVQGKTGGMSIAISLAGVTDNGAVGVAIVNGRPGFDQHQARLAVDGVLAAAACAAPPVPDPVDVPVTDPSAP